MRRIVATLAIAFAALAVLLVSPATGAQSTTKNACKYSYDGKWRDHDLVLSASATGTAAARSKITLSSLTMAAELPAYIPEYGYNLGLLQAGENPIPTKLSLAIAGSNTEEGSQVVQADVTATATATVDGDSVVGSPIAVQVSLPDTTWTATGDDIVVFTQAGPDTLPDGLPGAGATGTSNPTGSLYVSSSLNATLRFNLDCQPGRFAQDGAAVDTGPASPIATVTAAGAQAGNQSSTTVTTAAGSSQQPVTNRAGTTPAASTASTATPLAGTGPKVVVLELVAAALLLDFGYLAWSAGRRRRRAH